MTPRNNRGFEEFGPIPYDTSQLPSVPVHRPRRNPRVRRDPAPALLPFLVGVLGFVLVVELIGLAVNRVDPAWLNFARRSPVSVATTETAKKIVTPRTSHAPLVSKHGTTFTLVATRYVLVLNASAPCWAEVFSPATAKIPSFARTLQPGKNPSSITLTKGAQFAFGSTGVEMRIEVGHKVLARLDKPVIDTPYRIVLSHR